ncbi:MAG: nucleotidyltransferase domain-containing protein [Acidimicrobiales bacterium]
MTPPLGAADTPGGPRRAAPRLVGQLSRAVLGAPKGSPLRLLAPLRAVLLGEMSAADVVRVVSAVEEARVPCLVAGGWGVDALLGRQTRRHDDLDLLVERFPDDLAATRAALERLGFRYRRTERADFWMPERCILEDGRRRHRVDLVSMDWPRLRAALDAGRDRPVTLPDAARVTGLVGGAPVACLSAGVQRLLHPDESWRPVDHHDMTLLDALVEEVERPARG